MGATHCFPTRVPALVFHTKLRRRTKKIMNPFLGSASSLVVRFQVRNITITVR